QPQDLTDVGGYGPAAALAQRKDLKSTLQNSLDRGYEVTLSEEDINGYLSRTLAAKQGGLLGSNVSLDGAWVRLEEGRVEVVLERRIFGHPLTISTYIQITQTVAPTGTPSTDGVLHGGPYIKDLPLNRGGRFGQLVVPQGFLLLVLPSFQKLADLYKTEVELALGRMARIRIQKDKLILDPREPGDLMTAPGGTF
ncbi:MAG: hypothetical protein CFE26_21005, partial [Verrucomicrobiales bacterium VVV1]